MYATTVKTPRAQKALRFPTPRTPRIKLVPREKVEAMLHEIAYVLHVTRKVKREILEGNV